MTDDLPPDFETALAGLEEVVRKLEGEELELDEALRLFESGVAYLRTANRLLEEARGSVEELIAEASGELRTVEFEPEDEASEAGGDG